jgi:hypothetical protein
MLDNRLLLLKLADVDDLYTARVAIGQPAPAGGGQKPSTLASASGISAIWQVLSFPKLQVY